MALPEELEQLELELLQGSVRRNAARVTALLAPEFREFGSSGRVYDRQTIVASLQAETPVQFAMRKFGVVPLADDVALVTYEVERRSADGVVAASLRSSIWRFADGRWQMVFHQGTTLLMP